MSTSAGFWSERAEGDTGALGEWLSWGWDEEAAWRECSPGPELAEVMSRIAAVPGAFLGPHLDLAALINDVTAGLDENSGGGADAGAASSTDAAAVRSAANRVVMWIPLESIRQGLAVGLWLSGSGAVFGMPAWSNAAIPVLKASLALSMRLAPVVPPHQWVRDAERREEAARLFLLWLGLRPAGEDAETSRRILHSLDSAARTETLARAQAELQRKQEIATRLADQRAREAVARYSHD